MERVTTKSQGSGTRECTPHLVAQQSDAKLYRTDVFFSRRRTPRRLEFAVASTAMSGNFRERGANGTGEGHKVADALSQRIVAEEALLPHKSPRWIVTMLDSPGCWGAQVGFSTLNLRAASRRNRQSHCPVSPTFRRGCRRR